MSTGVEEHDRASLGRLEVSDHAVDIETLGLGVEVSVVADLNADSAEDGVVVSPGGVADVKGAGSELNQEVCNDTESTSAGEGLDGGNSSVTNKGAVEAEEDTLGALVEGVETVDGEVLLVEGDIGDNGQLGLAHNWEDVGLSVVITVGTNTKVDLLWVLVGLEACSQGQDRVRGGHFNVLELVVQSGDSS